MNTTVRPPVRLLFILIVYISVDHRVVLTIERSRFSLVTNTNQMVTSLLRNMGGFGGRDNWKRREGREIDNSKVKVLLANIVKVYKTTFLN